MHVCHVDYWTFVGKLIGYLIVKDSYTLKIKQNVSKLDKTCLWIIKNLQGSTYHKQIMSQMSQ